ncbi:MAG: hypothetical protein JNL58_01860 [Planctomyces sp.]|nr:hypothetical protein [Planctomyces sp.]
MQSTLSNLWAELRLLIRPQDSRRRNSRAQRHLKSSAEQIEARIMPAVVMAPVTDINTTTTAYVNPESFLKIGDITYFVATSNGAGRELWRTDGTPEGTKIVRDIARGEASSSPGWLTSFNGSLYFSATSTEYGNELWKSDGTEAGTTLVVDLSPGTRSSNPGSLTSFNGQLIFSADDGNWGRELWTTNGTPQGTSLLANINSSGSSGPALLTPVGDTLYFTANDGINGVELFRTNGIENDARRVVDIRPGSASSSPKELVAFGDRLYFVATTTSGNMLFRTDANGNSASSVAFQTSGKLYSSPSQLTVAGNQLYLSATSTGAGTELHVVRTHTSGVEIVKDIRTGTSSSSPLNLVSMGDMLYFTSIDSSLKSSLWTSDGTPNGTHFVVSGDVAASPGNLTTMSSTLFFTASDSINGRELWKYSPQLNTSTVVRPVFQAANAAFSKLTNVAGTLYFAAGNSISESTLWRSDGTESGTTEVFRVTVDANPGFIVNGGINVSYHPENAYAEMNGILYFAAGERDSGIELWRSDGTESGTWMVKDLRTGTQNSSPKNLTNVNGTLFFTAFSESGNSILWKSDGTSNGTVPVAPPLGQVMSSPQNLTNFNGKLFFMADAGNLIGRELWESDGTTNGTRVFKDLAAGSDSSAPSQLTVAGDRMYFAADDRMNGVVLWQTDGTVNGTSVVPGNFGSLTSLTVMGNRLFFISQTALYTTQGNGTVTTKLHAEVTKQPMAATENAIYFAGFSGSGVELWKTDGTLGGTRQVADINDGPPHSNLSELTAAGNRVFFKATDTPGHGEELWVSNGTSDGTHEVKEIAPGVATSHIQNLVADGDDIYFVATNGSHGLEVWHSDGTETGTAMVQDTLIGNGPELMRSAEWLMPRLMTTAGGKLFLSATNGVSGHELYTIGDETGPSGPPTILSPLADTISQTPVFSWSSVPGASTYDLWIYNVATREEISLSGLNQTSWQPNRSLGIAVFQFRVRAAGAGAVVSDWSPMIEFNIDTAVTVQSASPNQNTSRPTFSWQSLPGAVRYDVWIDNLSTGASQYLRNTNVTGTSWIAPNDFPVGRFRAWVRGVDADGIPARWSNQIDINAVMAPQPTGPEFATFSRQPTFSWGSVPGAASYDLWLQNLNTGAVTIYQKNIAALSWTTSQQLTDGHYRWWVQGRSPQNQLTLWSRPVNVYVGGQPAVLSPVGSTTSVKPVFSWTAVQGAVRYELWVSNSSNVRVIHSGSITSASYTAQTTLAKGTYRAWVRAYSSTGEVSVWSNTASFTIV